MVRLSLRFVQSWCAMPSSPPTVKFDLGDIPERVSKIRIRGGVVGKVSIVLISACAAFAAIAIASGNLWVCAGLGALLFVLILVLGIRILNFADRNPTAALYEGAELLVHERLKLAMKGGLPFTPDTTDLITDPQSPPLLIPADEAQQPDNAAPDAAEGG